jgi:uncharacterized membrane protein YfcA
MRLNMIYFLAFVICFLASIVGAICGIGGGVIIKPVLDAVGMMDVSSISFLSGCTVLAMSTYSVVKSKMSRESKIETKTGLPLAIGAAVGGIIGKVIFQFLISISKEQDKVGAIQAICLIIITVGTLLYTVYKNHIKTYHLTNIIVCLTIGVILGILSSFLGIGGGPINLVVLFFFFSMSTKIAAENSLYIIFFSQITSILQSLITGNVPEFAIEVLVLMVVGGICGGICGRLFNQKIEDATVDKLFISLMAVIILVNIYNFCKFI